MVLHSTDPRMPLMHQATRALRRNDLAAMQRIADADASVGRVLVRRLVDAGHAWSAAYLWRTPDDCGGCGNCVRADWSATFGTRLTCTTEIPCETIADVMRLPAGLSAHECRLVSTTPLRVPLCWCERERWRFKLDLAERLLPLWARECPGDQRPADLLAFDRERISRGEALWQTAFEDDDHPARTSLWGEFPTRWRLREVSTKQSLALFFLGVTCYNARVIASSGYQILRDSGHVSAEDLEEELRWHRARLLQYLLGEVP